MALEVRIKKRLDGFTLDVAFAADDGVTALLGASGCGKSMTLRCIAGVVRPDEGRIVLDGRVLFDSARRLNLPPQQRRVGFLFQNYALFPNMTVAQNIAAGLGGVKARAERERRSAALVQTFELTGLEHRYPHELSGGQQQRVALCRMLATRPAALLLDEPFSALDTHLRWQTEQEVGRSLADFSGTTLLVSHDRGEVYRLSRQVCVMHGGKSEPMMATPKLFENPGTMPAALLSGCKNFSAVRLLGGGRIYAEDWGLELETGGPLDKSVTNVGVRAHSVFPCEEGTENACRCRVEAMFDDVFSTVYMLRPEGARTAIRMELAKDALHCAIGDMLWIAIPHAAIMPLRP